jgi:hypothetical protein
MSRLTILTIITIIILMASPMSASAAPKHFYRDWRWWIGFGVVAVTDILDAHSTCVAFDKGIAYREGRDPLIRGSRSCGDVVKVATLGFAIHTTLHAIIWHCSESSFHPIKCYGMNDNESRYRNIWQPIQLATIPVINMASHLPAAIHNYQLPVVHNDK